MKIFSTQISTILLLFFIGYACSPTATDSKTKEDPTYQDSLALADSMERERALEPKVIKPDTSDLEHTLIEKKLVNVVDIVKDIQVDMKYSTTDNFLEKDVYEDFNHCYLQKEVAERLAQAQDSIKAFDPTLSLIVFDCVRPRSVQHKMWDIVKGTDQQKYVAAPGGSGSMHNYGAAVDLSLYDLKKDTLVDMGTPFDFFGDLAQQRYEVKHLKEGKLTQEQFDNRRILRKAMLQAGFHGILSEWWHFNGFPRDFVKKTYQIVE